MQTIEKFLSCDWGTSNFRLRLIEAATFTVLAQTVSEEGISATFNNWKQTNDNRQSFYLNIIDKHIVQLEEQLKISLKKIPVVLSGMASSTIGMMEMPYKAAPFYADGRDFNTEIISATESFDHDIIIISGATNGDDVMRGEETQLAGTFSDSVDGYLIFPGTHSKHVLIKDGQVTDIKTYMTGEFFELLSRKSILAASVEEGAGIEVEGNKQFFEQGISESNSSNILHNVFKVRTNSIFNKLTRQQNFYFLSGLLIGTELGILKDIKPPHISLVGNTAMNLYYKAAIEILLPGKDGYLIQMHNADDAVIKGQLRILCQLKYI